MFCALSTVCSHKVRTDSVVEVSWTFHKRIILRWWCQSVTMALSVWVFPPGRFSAQQPSVLPSSCISSLWLRHFFLEQTAFASTSMKIVTFPPVSFLKLLEQLDWLGKLKLSFCIFCTSAALWQQKVNIYFRFKFFLTCWYMLRYTYPIPDLFL